MYICLGKVGSDIHEYQINSRHSLVLGQALHFHMFRPIAPQSADAALLALA